MEWHTLSAEETARILGTDPENGLPAARAQRLLERCGENRIAEKETKNFPKMLFSQFTDFFVLILLAAALVSFVTSLFGGGSDYFDPVMILLIVLINATIGAVEESRAEKAIDALKKLSAPHARVKRGGRELLIPAEELVPGDLVFLEAGDLIPADLRVIGEAPVRAEESALTGEAEGAEKSGAEILPENTPLPDRRNLLFAGGSILSGKCAGIVVETGMNTQVGKIARMIGAERAPDTPLQQKLSQISRILGIGSILICAVIFGFGLLRKQEVIEMFLLSVSLAVAAIPEGLPAVVTIVLAIGVGRMARKKAIVRRLPAVETLGSATVICTDKTGTLTQNRMEVRQIWSFSSSEETRRRILRAGVLCSNVEAVGDALRGEPTETAIAAACEEDISYIQADFPRVKEIPFTSERKRMTTVHRAGERLLAVTKGAPDLLLPRCSGFEGENGPEPMGEEARRRALGECARMAGEALRVLAVGFKTLAPDQALEEDAFTFLGLIALEDPLRPKVANSVALCRKAGIRIVMITGDHRATAGAIARKAGICEREDQILSGGQLSRMSEETLAACVEDYRVFARVAPEHKVRIVKALQKKGNVVAMTGDGINDAPALKAADIGCAMGKSGTEVAKSAADLIITDDDFSSIAEAVREGRGIYRNIMQTVRFLLSCNFGELLCVFLSILLAFPLPFSAIQLLWVNLITDSLPALALGAEPIDETVMRQKPNPKGGRLFSAAELFDLAAQGALIGVLSVLAYAIGRCFFDLQSAYPLTGRTMGFAVLSLSQIAHVFQMRSSRSILKTGLPSGSKLAVCAAVCVAAQTAVIEWPPAAAIFGTCPLSAGAWGIVAFLSVLPLILAELIRKR